MFDDDDDMFFTPEAEADVNKAESKKWKLLVVDDDQAVYKSTSMVLSDFVFEGSGIEFLCAYSAEEAKAIIEKEKDIAVILLDVVMETNNAGLEFVRWIRNEHKDNIARIILRTGQPGEAPEEDVIRDYDINGYINKSETTSRKLFSLIYTGLRSYRDLCVLEENRAGLKGIVDASADLFQKTSLIKLSEGVITQIVPLFSAHDSIAMLIKDDSEKLSNSDLDYEILATSGRFKDQDLGDIDNFGKIAPDLLSKINADDFGVKTLIVESKKIILISRASHHNTFIFYSEGDITQDNVDRELFDLFAHNVSIAFKNLCLYSEIIESQKEFIWRLGDIVETRSRETSSHTHRVAKISSMIGKKLSMVHEEIEALHIASALHDLGKIGISDAVLLKPGLYTEEERAQMQEHTQIGFNLLKVSDRPLLQLAGTIAHQHHERWDGKGYPDGLKGEEISLGGRITCLADVYDALASERTYKDAWPRKKVFAFIRENRGAMFDPQVVDAFFDLDEIQALENSLENQ